MFERVRRLRTLESTTAALVGENDRLRLDAAVLRKENRALRKRVRTRSSKIILKARAAADIMATSHLARLSTSRRESTRIGLSERAWDWGAAMLALAKVRRRDGRWLHSDMAIIGARLDQTVIALQNKGIESLQREATKSRRKR